MARPAKNQRDNKGASEVLLEAASQLMIREGTHDVSLHSIAREAGLTAALVKYYFGSKEGLLVALIERDTARGMKQLRELIDMPIDPVTKMRLHISGVVRGYDRHPYVLGLFNELLRGSGTTGAEHIKKSFVLPLMAAQRAIVEEGVRDGYFKPVDPDHYYFIIIGACQYLFGSRVAFHDIMGGKSVDPVFTKDFTNATVEIILNGMCETPRRTIG